MYANRAANAAPEHRLWFLLGYSARLAGQYQVLDQRYIADCAIKPGSYSLSGLAKLRKMGRQTEARDALQKVLAANPRSVNDLQLAGEISLNHRSERGPQFLKRAKHCSPRREANC